MDNVKEDGYYLAKILSDLDFIIEQTKGKSEEEIEGNPLLLDSIMFRIIQVGENAGRLSERFKKDNVGIPWMAIRGMRNRIVHDYGGTKLTMVFDTVAHWIPQMREELGKIDG